MSVTPDTNGPQEHGGLEKQAKTSLTLVKVVSSGVMMFCPRQSPHTSTRPLVRTATEMWLKWQAATSANLKRRGEGRGGEGGRDRGSEGE